MKKTFSFLTAIIFSALSLFALPGFTPKVQDMNGEYVYYRDTTFARESYIGFLCYDSGTYAARYYAPEVKKENKKAKSIVLYFTIDESKPYMSLTGEKVENGMALGREDTEIVNYIHDMLYELNARRIKAGTPLPVVTQENFMQFGGDVQIEFDDIIPLFNVKSIVNQTEGKKVFYVVTAGRLIQENDNGFSSFSGFPKQYKDNSHKMPSLKKATPVEAKTADDISVKIDSAWNQVVENLWTLGDAAILTMGEIPQVPSVEFMERQLLLSKGTSYVDWNLINSKQSDNSLYLVSTVYDPSTNKVNNVIQSVLLGESNSLLILSVYNNIYTKNRKYFNSIVSSFKK